MVAAHRRCGCGVPVTKVREELDRRGVPHRAYTRSYAIGPATFRLDDNPDELLARAVAAEARLTNGNGIHA
jgi:hypothetical protein